MQLPRRIRRLSLSIFWRICKFQAMLPTSHVIITGTHPYSCHRLVCQTAGKLQGLLPGDLGDVGRASLNNKEIDKLLKMTVTDHDISTVRMGTDVTKPQKKGPWHSQTRLDTREPSLEPTDLSLRHFELCARLLACSQRQYLSDAEWDTMGENPVDVYVEAIPNDPHPETSCLATPTSKPFNSCSQSDFEDSPWISRVGLPLWSFCDNAVSRETSSQLEAAATQETSVSAASPVFTPQSDIQHFASVLQAMSDKMYDETSKSPVPFLQLVCACAETFPMGQCWTSSTQHNWHAYTPKDLLSEDKAYCNGCSPDDIALVVSLVTNILEAFGGPNGNVQTQRWALTCLIRLAESSALVAFASEQKGEASSILHVVWQRVWNTLFRTDLRYASYTRNATSDTLGELVLVLLTEIVKRRCTDPPLTRGLAQTSIGEFVHANQEKVWSLDAFSNAASVHVQAVFDVINAILHCVGLSEGERDLIDGTGPTIRPESWDGIPTSTRRYRLVALCLRYLEASTDAADNNRELTEAAAACLLALVTGKLASWLSTFDKAASIGFCDHDALRQFFCVTNMPVDRRDRRLRDSPPATFLSFFQCLWNDQVDTLPKSWLPDTNLPLIEFDDSELTVSRELLIIGRQLLGDRHCDFVSEATASALRRFVTDILVKLSASPSDGRDDNYEFDESAMIGQVSGISVASMVSRISYLKLLMTVGLSSADDEVFKQSDMDELEIRLISIFDEIVDHFPAAEQDDEHCVTIMTYLLQVLQALSVVSLSIDGASIPETISTRLKSIYGMCKRLLREYSKSRELVPSTGTSERQANLTDFFESDDELEQREEALRFSESEGSEDGTASRRRRSANSWDGNVKRRRLEESLREELCECPSSQCANRIASILVLLQPSYGLCRLVADAIALPREDGGGRRGRGSSCDADVDASLHCLNLFCRPLVMHRSQTTDEDSTEDEVFDADMELAQNGTIISLCCDLVNGIRIASGPGTLYSLFGFEVCADLVHQRENKGCGTLDSSERHGIIDILLPSKKEDRKVLKGTPSLKARQITAATSVFRDARERLHVTLDPKFKQEIIGLGINDLTAPVRKQAASAVGAALRAFTQQANIVNGVKKGLPPLFPKEGVSLSGQFSAWWEKKSPALASESGDSEDSVFRGIFFSMQAFAVEAMGVITASTTANELFCDCLSEIVLLAAERPDLEALCYHAIEKTAGLAGFDTVQHLLISECEYICEKWLETGNLLQDMPLLLTAPSVLFQLLQAGSAKYLLGGGAIQLSKAGVDDLRKDKRFVALEDVRRSASREYVERSARFLVPIICIRKARRSSGDVGMANRYLEEATELAVGTSGAESTRKLLTAHFPNIIAAIEPYLHCVDEKTLQDGQEVVSYLKQLLTEDGYGKLRQKKARVAVHQLLQNWGKDGRDFESCNLSKEIVLEAIMALAQESTGKRAKEPFAVIGSSVTECILHGRFWLSQSVLVRQKERRWSAIELVFSLVLKFIKTGPRWNANSQLGYCIHTILDVLADPTLTSIYPAALNALNDFLAEVLTLKVPSNAMSEISPVFYRLIGTLATTHERYQDALIEQCLSSWTKDQWLLHRSSGLLLSAKSSRNISGGAWGWDVPDENTRGERIEAILAKEASNIDKRIFDTLTGTYDALERLFDNAQSLRGDSAVPIECLSKFASETEISRPRSLRNERLCARSLTSHFLESELSKPHDIKECVSTFLKVSKILLASHLGSLSEPQEPDQSLHEVTRDIHQYGKSLLRTDFRLLVDELNHVRRAMELSAKSPLEFSARVEVSLEDRYALTNLLLKLCKASYPEGIRAAASRCLGALGPSDVENLASAELELSENESGLFLASQQDGDLLPRIKGSCLELLSQYLLSPRPETAIAALEAAKAILASKDGPYQLVESKVCKRLLDPLVRTKNSSRPKPAAFVAPSGYLHSMLQRVTAGEVELSTEDDLTWCWHEILWMSARDGALCYEDWVKFITCAMISCCFVEDDEVNEKGGDEPVRGSGTFFRYCIKLCALEHEFATKAFPGIVLDLLFNGQGTDSTSRVLDSKGEFSESLASQHISRCFATLIEPTSSTGDAGGDLAPCTQALTLAVETIDMLRFIMQKTFEKSKHRSNVDTREERNGRSKRQRTIPGIVLHLNGLSVARACMQANRFASALFYADMHSEMCYGSADRILERLSNGELSYGGKVVDISGYDEVEEHTASDETEPNSEHSLDGKLLLPLILHQSFTALRDDDAAGAVNLESAAISFLDDRFKWTASNSLQFDTLGRLKYLDLQCQDQNGRVLAGQRVADCMEDIRLEDALQTYSSSLANRTGSLTSGLSPDEHATLRDQWFLGSLKSMQWDGEIFSGSLAQDYPQSPVGSSEHVASRRGFHEGLTKALSSFMKDDFGTFRQTLSQARGCLIDALSQVREGEAPLRGLVKTVENLQFLNDVENLRDGESCKSLALLWQSQNEAALGDNVVEYPLAATEKPLRLSETVMCFREVMLRAFQAKASHGDDFKESIVSHLWQMSSVARLAGRSDYADSSVQRLYAALYLKHPAGLDELTLLRVRFEEARVMEGRGDFSSAIRGLKLLSSHLEGLQSSDDSLPPPYEALYADTMLSCGELMSRYKVEPGQKIMDRYLKPATELADAIRDKDENGQTAHRSFAAHLALAKLTSGLFDSLCKTVESPEWAKAGANITLKENELKICERLMVEAAEAAVKARGKKSKRRSSSSGDKSKCTKEEVRLEDLRIMVQVKQTELTNMRNERAKTTESIPIFLELALGSYCQAMIHASNGESSDVSTHVYRLISLWFGNCSQSDRSKTVHDVTNMYIRNIPSFRFVPLAYQIFSRIASGPEEFQDTLKSLVSRMCQDHPYHCIIQLIALSNGEKAGSARGSEDYLENVDADKVRCAEDILDDIEKNGSPFVSGLVQSYRVIVKAYIELALASTDRYKRGKDLEDIPLAEMKSEGIDPGTTLSESNLGSYSYLPCIITQPPDINPGGHYGDGLEEPKGSERIKGFSSKFSITGKGLSRPKFIMCHGTLKGRYKQVVKGNDDVRGDAVMQQVFCFVNNLMKRRNTDSSKSTDRSQRAKPARMGSRALKDQLKIVTYHIVPTSPVAGVMEFVKDSVVFGDYCVGKSKDVGAHSKYYPGEWGHHDIRDKLQDAGAGEKLAVYEKICQNFSPVFRYFFTERFGHSLPLWYAAKMKFTRSCAVNSIVGHMLGIGDRHIHNILIKEKTGECVHIDFGIVFEQGKVSLRDTVDTCPRTMEVVSLVHFVFFSF